MVNISRLNKHGVKMLRWQLTFLQWGKAIAWVSLCLNVCVLPRNTGPGVFWVQQHFPGGCFVCLCLFVCVMILWYGACVLCNSEWGSPDTVFLGTSLWSHHDGETRHWGGYSTGQQLREGNKAAQTRSSCNSSNRVCWGYGCTNTQGFTHCALCNPNLEPHAQCIVLLKCAKLH